ncbi:MAG: ABC transporter ATP-binding protein [Chloroflexi bacterium]|nr:ABC transporter ATP-binding protein [Chloroflexota bacterium]
MSQIKVSDLSKNFGGITAVNHINLTIKSGERHAIIGPNGAGKSTLFNLIAGELPPTQGNVYLDGQNITALPVHQRANMGLGHTFQRNNLFMGLTVFENVRLAVQHQQRVNRHWFRAITTFSELRDNSDSILAQVGLLPLKENPVNMLAYGQQRALEIALALATKPTVMLLDEPTAGMSPAETIEMIQLIHTLPRSLTMMIVEHDMDVIFSLTDQITVLHYGQVISQGSPDEVHNDPMVQEIYLGINS